MDEEPFTIKHYKLAKQFKEDCNSIFPLLSEIQGRLSSYTKYYPILAILSEIKNQESLLKANLVAAEKIINKSIIVGGKEEK